MLEGMSIRAISRFTGMHKTTILSILETAGANCRKLWDAKIRGIRTQFVQADEVWKCGYAVYVLVQLLSSASDLTGDSRYGSGIGRSRFDDRVSFEQMPWDIKVSSDLNHDLEKFSKLSINLMHAPIPRSRAFCKNLSAIKLLTPRIYVRLQCPQRRASFSPEEGQLCHDGMLLKRTACVREDLEQSFVLCAESGQVAAKFALIPRFRSPSLIPLNLF